MGDDIEIRPGVAGQAEGRAEALHTKITALISGGQNLDVLKPGGLAAIGTSLDPSLAKADGLTGRLVGTPGDPASREPENPVKATLLDRVLGAARETKVEKSARASS